MTEPNRMSNRETAMIEPAQDGPAAPQSVQTWSRPGTQPAADTASRMIRGTSNALTCVRVVMTVCSPSIISLRGSVMFAA